MADRSNVIPIGYARARREAAKQGKTEVHVYAEGGRVVFDLGGLKFDMSPNGARTLGRGAVLAANTAAEQAKEGLDNG